MTIFTKLTREDAFELLELASKFHQESPFANKYKFNPESLWELLDCTLKYPSTNLCVYVKREGKIIGFLLGHMTEQFCSFVKIAKEQAMYIVPEYRGGTTFMKMFKVFEQWAKDNKAQEIFIGHSSGIKTETATSLFPRLGYSLTGYTYNKELNNGRSN